MQMHRPSVSLLGLALCLSACAPASPSPTALPPNPQPPPATLAATGSPSATTRASSFEIVRTISTPANPPSLPVDIAFDSGGNMYVLEAGASRVEVFSPSGESLRTWGSMGFGPGQFSLAAPEHGALLGYGGLTIDKQDNVYVADAFNHRIQKFDTSGKLLMQWGSQGTEPGKFARPLGINRC
jgi:hypothetical protein